MPANVDLTASGNFGAVGEGLFMTGSLSTDPGTFETFVRMQRNGTQQGYNSDAPPQYDEKANSNHSILLSDVPIVFGDGTGGTVEGVAYREFLFNINEPSGAKRTISLDELQIWQNEAGNLTNFTPDQGFAGIHTNYLAYDLDAGGDAWVLLDDDVPGGGVGDVRILIPDSAFINDAAHRYVTVYSKFGEHATADTASDGGDDDWGLNGTPQNSNSTLSVFASAVVEDDPPTQDDPASTADEVGDVINYSFTLYNVADVAQTGVVVTDSLGSVLIRGAAGHNGDEVLDVGEVWSYTAQYIVTQQDIDSAVGGGSQITNTVTADSAQTIPDVAHSTVPLVWGPAVTLDKKGTVGDGAADEAGDVISYAIFVTNTGQVALTNPVVVDSGVTTTPVPNFSAPILSNSPFLVPVIAGDYNIGDDNNNFIVDPTDQNGIEDAGETFVYANAGDDNQNGVQDEGETFLFANVGDTNQNGAEDDGEDFQYYTQGDTDQDGIEDIGEEFEFLVTPVLATPVVDQDGFNAGDIDQDGKLSPGETWRYSVPSYELTQADIDNRVDGVPTVDPDLSHDSTATVVTDEQATATDTDKVEIVQNPQLTLVKTASVGDGTADAAGETISYAISVTNDGNMTLTGVSVSDLLTSVSAPALVTAPTLTSNGDGDLELAVGETWQYTASYTITQDDIDNGGVLDSGLSIDNTATVTTAQDATASDTEAVAIVQDPSVTLVKALSDPNATADVAGEEIGYTISITNDGNMTLTGVEVDDPNADEDSILRVANDDDDGDNRLEVGETWTYTAAHTVTQEEIDNGGIVDPESDLSILNTATVTTDQDAASDTETVAIVQDPSVTLVKALSDPEATADVAGEEIGYTISITNDGNMTLTGVVVDDPNADEDSILRVANGDGDEQLEVGETWTYTAAHTVTQEEIDNGGIVDPESDLSIANTASVTTDQGANANDTESVAIVQDPSVTLVSTASVPENAVDGQVIDYTINITNDGNMTLSGVVVSDPNAVAGSIALGEDGDGDDQLEVGETWTYTASHTVAQTEIDAGGIDTTAIVSTDQAATVCYVLGPDDHDLTLTGIGNDNIKGNVLDNVLIGNVGNNRLNGGQGGNDWLTGAAGADTFVFGDWDGVDRVIDFEDGVDTIDLTAVDGVNGFDDLTLWETEGGGVGVGFGSGAFVLAGVSQSLLGATDFVF